MENEQIRESLQEIIRYLENYEEMEHLPVNPSHPLNKPDFPQ